MVFDDEWSKKDVESRGRDMTFFHLKTAHLYINLQGLKNKWMTGWDGDDSYVNYIPKLCSTFDMIW